MAKDTGTQTILVAASEDRQRVDRVLAQHAGLSRSRLKALILAGEIAIDGRTIRDPAHRALAAQFADHGRAGPLERGYLGFVWGAPDRPKGRIEAEIARHPHARDKMAVRQGGRHAVTHWEVAERYFGAGPDPVASLLACRLETGRTHQIRVHLAHIGHPLIGDRVYGPGFKTKAALLGPDPRDALARLDRQALHAHILGFEHPKTRHFLEFRSELPVELARLRDSLARNGAQKAAGIG